MASQPKQGRPSHWGEVREVERLTPSLIRVELTGEGLSRFEAGEFTDHYVKVQIPPPGAPYVAPFDPEPIKAELPRELWPRVRSITVRRWQAEQQRLTLDFVDHGPAGFAGPWAAAAKAGDILQLVGPGGAYRPDPEAGWHLMVGDLAALPAIAASLERVEPGARAIAVIGVERDDDRLELSSPGKLDLRWVAAEEIAETVAALELPAEGGEAFVHGEAEMVRAVRRHLALERGLAVERMSASGYWKRDRSDEAWRAEKPEWKRLAEADLQAM